MADGSQAEGGGHFNAPKQEGTPSKDANGEFGAFNSLKPDRPLTLQERLASFKDKGAAVARAAYEQTAAATASIRQKAAERDWTKEQTALTKAQKAAMGAAERVTASGSKAAEKVGQAATAGGNFLWNAGSRAGNALRGDAVTVLARQEAGTRPCPRTVLVCCSSLIATGPTTPHIFSEGTGADLVHFLLNSFEDAQGCFLPPPGTSPHVVANVLKAFFKTLPEPLLTYKVLPTVIHAGGISSDTATLAPPILMELPAANLNALWLLLETLNRIAAEAATNEMDARALAAALAPCIAWHAPPPKSLSGGGAYSQAQGHEEGHLGLTDEEESHPEPPPGAEIPAGRREMAEDEAASVARVLEYYIINFGALTRRVYWTPSGQPALLPD